MSISMDGDGMTDYSSFDYQQIDCGVSADNPDSSGDGNVALLAEVEPLQPIGGLDNNEVAELVYLETYAAFEEEPESSGEAPDYLELRGVVGANLSPSTSAGISTTSGPPSVSDNMELTRIDGYSDLDEGDGWSANGRSEARDEIFQVYRTASGGANAGASGDHFYATKNWRELTGRGPVLDSTDDIGISLFFVPGEGVDQNVRGNVRCHMVWDVAETTDAGRAFSVPS